MAQGYFFSKETFFDFTLLLFLAFHFRLQERTEPLLEYSLATFDWEQKAMNQPLECLNFGSQSFPIGSVLNALIQNVSDHGRQVCKITGSTPARLRGKFVVVEHGW